jgi:hypothetical protein
MMARTQITLDPELHRKARARASELGISLAEYIRRLVARDLEPVETRLDVSALFNLGDSREKGLPPIEDWDAAVAEAIEAEGREEGWID